MEEADDLVQSTVERALDRLHQWRPGTRLDSWMFCIMKNIRLTQLRRRTELTGSSQGVNDIRFSVDGVRCVEAKLTLNAVRQAFEQLPEAQREVLYLVCVEGLRYKETAEVLNIPIGTVTSRLARARLELHQRLGNTQDDETGNIAQQSLDGR
jgi:RNA polymerase sigma-70 factor (ECF subfamily)